MSVAVLFSPQDDEMRWRAVLLHYGVKQARVAGAEDVYLVVNDEAEGAQDLAGFEHPGVANYIFGPDDAECPFKIPSGAMRVTLPESPLYAAQVAAIVLYDRQLKMGDAWRSQDAS